MVRQYPISRDGWLYLAVLALLTIAAFFLWPWLAILPGILLLFVAYFFRNPERIIASDPLALISPADGVVMDIERVYEERFFQGESIRVRIFLSVFNVHVNRAPMAGKVVYAAYKEGKMLPAFKSHASELNEKNMLGIENEHTKLLVTQVTGFIARRIVCWTKQGDSLEKGERFGLIKFGSCTEVFVSPDVEIMVKPGQKVKGGLTVVGKVNPL